MLEPVAQIAVMAFQGAASQLQVPQSCMSVCPLAQVLEHPGCIWDLCFTPAGDLVTGCSDGVARVWSVDPERKVGGVGQGRRGWWEA